jgi:hypothetical protein
VWEFFCVNCNVVGHLKGNRYCSYNISGASYEGVNLNLNGGLACSRKSLVINCSIVIYVLRIYQGLGVTVHVIQRVQKVYTHIVKLVNNFGIS